MQSPFDFSGYRVLIAGGSKGIGRAMARAFAKAGAGNKLWRYWPTNCEATARPTYILKSVIWPMAIRSLHGSSQPPQLWAVSTY